MISLNDPIKEITEVRKKNLEKNINRQYTLLQDWLKKRDLAENPNEIARSEDEIARIKRYLEEYIREYTDLLVQEGTRLPDTIISILNELKQGQRQLLDKQETILVTLDQVQVAILSHIAIHHDFMQSLLSLLNEQETRMVHAIVEAIDSQGIAESEMVSLLKEIQQGYALLESKNFTILPADKASLNFKKLPEVWKSPDISTGGKLKLSIPIIPQILTYEAELSISIKESLKDFWEKFWK